MDALAALRLFTRVAAARSFSSVARSERLAQSQVSRAVRALEDRVGARLLDRSTRAVSLTAEGRRYLLAARSALATLEAADSELRRQADAPAGTLRVTAPVELAELLGPVLARLALEHGDLAVEAYFSDRSVDLVGEGYDVAIRSGVLAASELRAVRLGTVQTILCAAPAYVERRGAPATPRDLAGHETAIFTGKKVEALRLTDERGRQARARLSGRLRANDLRVVRAAAIAGTALAVLPMALAAPHLLAGTLVRILPRWSPPPSPLHAVMPARSPRPARISVFLEAARAACAASPLAGS